VPSTLRTILKPRSPPPPNASKHGLPHLAQPPPARFTRERSQVRNPPRPYVEYAGTFSCHKERLSLRSARYCGIIGSFVGSDVVARAPGPGHRSDLSADRIGPPHEIEAPGQVAGAASYTSGLTAHKNSRPAGPRRPRTLEPTTTPVRPRRRHSAAPTSILMPVHHAPDLTAATDRRAHGLRLPVARMAR
jgi:hypothetical protein